MYYLIIIGVAIAVVASAINLFKSDCKNCKNN